MKRVHPLMKRVHPLLAPLTATALALAPALTAAQYGGSEAAAATQAPARLATTPGFDSKSWPDFADEHWNRENRGHYEK